MELSIAKSDLKAYLGYQLCTLYPDNILFKGEDIDIAFERALERLEYCFKHIVLPAYSNEDGQTFFSHLHSDQYSQFLYFFSNSLWNISENKVICDKVILLNKQMNAMFYSYKGKLPDIFLFAHPVGTILGNAEYHDFLVVFQNVTVNTDIDEYGHTAPKLGAGLFLGAGAKIIGNKPIGDRVSIGVDAVVYNKEIADDKVVIKNELGNVVVKSRKKESCMAQRYFRVKI